jgi:membrane-associated phospholipid phosphatase
VNPTFATFLKTLPRTVVSAFCGRNILWHLLAIGVTAALVHSGFDWWYFLKTRSIPGPASFPAVVMGAFLPVIAPVTLLIIGYRRRADGIKRAGFAIGQAALIAGIISSAYKAITGRTEPPLDGPLIDNSHDFNFGFWQNGIFWGWPSGHTMTAFAMAVALITLLPRHTRITIAALVYAAYIGLSVSVSIHWFSDFIAGLIIGSVIGLVTGTRWAAQTIAGRQHSPGSTSPQLNLGTAPDNARHAKPQPVIPPGHARRPDEQLPT